MTRGSPEGWIAGRLRLSSEALAISHPGTVRLVDRLVSAGLVERGPGPDRRTVGVQLTADGRRRWALQCDARVVCSAPQVKQQHPVVRAVVQQT